MLAGHRWAMRGINQAQPSAHNCSQASAQGEGGDQGGQRKVQLEKKGAPRQGWGASSALLDHPLPLVLRLEN